MYLNQDIPNRKTLYQVPGGRLAEVFGTRRVFGYSMLVCAALAAATPALATLPGRLSFPACYALRLAQVFIPPTRCIAPLLLTGSGRVRLFPLPQPPGGPLGAGVGEGKVRLLRLSGRILRFGRHLPSLRLNH